MRRHEHDFSYALAAAKDGARIERRGWNGRDMWVFLHPALRPHPYMPGLGRVRDYPIGSAADTAISYTINIGPFLCMRAADGTFVPWLASQTDLLADDWSTVEG